MRVCCLGHLPPSPENINSFSGVFGHFLNRELLRLGVELQWFKKHEDVVGEFDHLLAFGNRWFSHFGGQHEVRKNIRGAITQIAENPRQDDGVDQTFTVNSHNGEKCTYVGWAADREFFYPESHPYILLDHPEYNEHQMTKMGSILRQAREYEGRFKVYRLLEDGIQTINKNAENFTRTAEVPFPDMAAITRRTAIFVVTHRESCGLQCLEAAMSGAVILYPKGFLNPAIAESLPSIQFDEMVPWGKAEAMYDQNIARDSVLHFQWQRVAVKILEYFCNYVHQDSKAD